MFDLRGRGCKQVRSKKKQPQRNLDENIAPGDEVRYLSDSLKTFFQFPLGFQPCENLRRDNRQVPDN